MSTYEYRDTDGDELEVEHRPVTGLVMVSAYTRNEADALVQIHVNVNPDDAPALSLAVLEAAEIGNASSRHLAAAWRNLNRYETERKAEADREAEDASVRAWLQAVYPNTAAAHPDVELSEHMRQKYQQNRDYFAKIDAEIIPAEIVEPRVLNYGDPEPDRNTKWRSDRAGFLQHDGTGWTSTVNTFPRVWDWYSKLSFPMTEVTA